MITALCLRTVEKQKGIKGLFNKLRPDKVSVSVKKARGVSLKQITYTSYNGKLRLEKIDEAVGSNKNKLLCSEKLCFPQDSGYRRFFSYDFIARLCSNMGISVLENMKNTSKLRVGIYDPDGESKGLLFSVLRYCSDIVAVTDYPDSFYGELNQALDEMGASAVITKNRLDLADCNLIIAPCVIEERLPVKSNALILTVEFPKIAQDGLVYYKYDMRMPNGFDLIKPDCFDEVYFCSALYTLAGQYELGSIVPQMCMSYSSSQKVVSLSAYLNSLCNEK